MKHLRGKREKTKRSVIRLADNRTIAAQGMGDVLISKKDGSNALLSDVLFVPGMKSNLVSIGQLVEKGFKLKCEEGVLELFDQQGKRMLKIPLAQNRTFQVDLSVTESSCMSTEIL